MMNILSVDVGPNGEQSTSRKVARRLVEKLKRPTARAINRDLSTGELPHLDGSMLQAIFTRAEARTADHANILQKSDELVDELLAADAIVISTPVWNFGPPSSLKAWIDLVVRIGRTFSCGG